VEQGIFGPLFVFFGYQVVDVVLMNALRIFGGFVTAGLRYLQSLTLPAAVTDVLHMHGFVCTEVIAPLSALRKFGAAALLCLVYL
jgi:hypothetical protein